MAKKKKKKPHTADPFMTNPLITGAGGIFPALVDDELWVIGAAAYLKRLGPERFLVSLLQQLRESLPLEQGRADVVKAAETFVTALLAAQAPTPETGACGTCATFMEILLAVQPLSVQLVALKAAQNAHLEAMRDQALGLETLRETIGDAQDTTTLVARTPAFTPEAPEQLAAALQLGPATPREFCDAVIQRGDARDAAKLRALWKKP